jgi:hypothetical protein
LEIHREIFFFRSGLISPVLPGSPIIDNAAPKRPARGPALLQGDHS